MAAPSGTTWGNTVGSYGRIGLYTSLSNTDTQTKVTIQIWFWSKYSVSDSGNTLYYDNRASSGSASTSRGSVSISTTVDTGSGWSTSNQKKLKTYTATYDRAVTDQKRYLYAKLAGIDRVGGTMYVSKNITIPKLAYYTVSYNANGGSNAPDNQTKLHGVPLTLSPTVPTRDGHTFRGWGSSPTATSPVNYPNGTFDGDYDYTYYAIWAPNTYAIKYDANGGINAPGNQTKTYNQMLTLSMSIPTRDGHDFQGWGTSATDTTVDYKPGAIYVGNESLNLYAIWKQKTYTITYNANGGTGSPENQIKQHDVALTLSSTIPTKPDHSFKGWSLLENATTANYQPNGTYTNNSNITLYAVWEIAYKKPTISNLQVSRCDAGGNPVDSSYEFTSGLVTFDWSTYNEVTRIDISWVSSAGDISGSVSTDDVSGNKGSINFIFGADSLPMDQTLTVYVEVFDDVSNISKSIILEGNVFTIDMLGGGNGVAFGRAAEIENVADFDFEIKARKNINADAELNVTGKSTLSGGVDATTVECKVIHAAEKSGFSGGIDTSTVNCYSIELFHETPYIDFHFGNDSGDYTSRIIEYERGKLSTDNWQVNGVLTLGGVVHTGNNKILWASSSMMNAEDTVTLSEAISAQPNGVVLVWSCYSTNTVQDWGWTTNFIPKSFVANHPSGGMDIPLMRQSVSVIGCKYVYVNDTTIKGHANNSLSGTATTGPSYNNGYWVLRYVIGV